MRNDTLSVLNKIRVQAHSLERTIRILRSEVEGEIDARGSYQAISGKPIASGLQTLLMGPGDVPVQDVSAYAEFEDGVCVGYDLSETGVNVAVECKRFSRNADFDGAPAANLLTVYPSFTTSARPGWLTLESQIDKTELVAAKGFRIGMLSRLDIEPDNIDPMPRTIHVALRGTLNEDEFTDIKSLYIPSSTHWLETTLVINAAEKKKMKLDQYEKIQVLLHLPVSGNYKFQISDFDISENGG